MGRFGRDEYLKLVRGETKGAAARLTRGALSAAALAYGAGVAVRNFAFDHGWRKVHHAAVPVISVGNLTLGGTGKTPTVEWIARWYRDRGVRVALLSRGYGREGAVNDEGLALEENLPDVPHLQDPDRVRMAAVAVSELESQLLVLDDAFQHRRIARDLDIVLIDALDPFGLNRVFPRGLLREPLKGLRRADLVMITQADLVPGTTLLAIRNRAERAVGRPLGWVHARKAPIELIGGELGPEPLQILTDCFVAAFSGIGNPDGFRRTLEKLKPRGLAHRTFPDHHLYRSSDVEDLAAWARAVGADLLLTTQKDLVKLRVASLGPIPLRALRIGLEPIEGGSLLEGALARLKPTREADPPPGRRPASRDEPV